MAEIHESKMERKVRREIRSPRSAALAGIIYSILMFTIMLLSTSLVRVKPEDINEIWLDNWSGTASLVITLLPFAGIAFMWFTGVIRDRLGEREDRFFATIFFGSGIIMVSLLFLWGAIFGAVISTKALFTLGLSDNFTYVFAFALMNEIVGNYTLRMAGVYMISIGTLWTRTSVMPRWLNIATFILAVGFLIAANSIRETRFIFPAWVFVVSVYILILNFRRTHEQAPEAI